MLWPIACLPAKPSVSLSSRESSFQDASTTDRLTGGRQATFTDPDGNVLEIVQINWEKYFDVSAKGAKKVS